MNVYIFVSENLKKYIKENEKKKKTVSILLTLSTNLI